MVYHLNNDNAQDDYPHTLYQRNSKAVYPPITLFAS